MYDLVYLPVRLLTSGNCLLILSLPGRQDLEEDAERWVSIQGLQTEKTPKKLQKAMKRATAAGTRVPGKDPCS
jgi:hypothetical protein